ncbi:hypothetical protein [Mycolicibacter hiberniae]|uniref:Peptidase C1A papain C-terminal domain-containing protein n=1 Tax=Mycolicibacter hiberniae TaxID=29314 RepID=A0A7I7WX69_9MYCO|nr:hypothetical protein [Mycolicibacter hiberniae]BBZ22104.1 hypothetical protein MHIB_05220 [Mycolicibacter hiberniae]
MAKVATRRRERKRICNLVPTPPKSMQTDWKLTDAVAAGVLGAPAALPANVDLRSSWWGIGDQGNTGSCVGWASTDGVARYMFVTAGRLAKTERLSPRFAWMASKETDQFTSRPETMIEGAGTTLKAAADILRNYGAVPDSMLPFKINTAMYSGNENTFYATAATHKIASYFNLQLSLDNWRAWLSQHGPILVGARRPGCAAGDALRRRLVGTGVVADHAPDVGEVAEPADPPTGELHDIESFAAQHVGQPERIDRRHLRPFRTR